jgi:hypothetical protein
MDSTPGKRLAPLLVTAALALAGAPAAHAGLDSWTIGNQVGGSPTDVALSGSTALAGYTTGGFGGGVFRSGDGGLTWSRLTALDYRDVEAVAIDPSPGGAEYAATMTGIMRSLDGGTTWAEVYGGQGSGHFFNGVAADRGQPGTVFFLRWTSSGGGIYRSTTSGAGTWTNVSAGITGTIPFLNGVIVDPVSHWAWGWRNGEGVFVLIPGDTTWQAANTGLPSTSVSGIALDGSGSRRMIVSTTSGMATLPAAGGPSWTTDNTGLGADTYGTSISSDGAGNAYLVTLGGRMWRLPAGGTTWSALPAGGMPAAFANRLVGDPATSGHVLDLASTFGEPNAGLGPLWGSTDGGDTFTRAAAGFRAAAVEAIAPDAHTPGRVLAGTRHDAVQRSQDGGATWGPAATGLPKVDVGALAQDGGDPAIWYAASNGNGIYRANDGGSTWAAVGTGDPLSAQLIRTVPGQPGLVFAAEGGTAVKSADHGDTWAPLPALPGGATGVHDIVPDPTQVGAVWAATDRGVIHLAPGDPVWSQRSNGLAGIYVSALAVDPRAPGTLFAATAGGGIYRSTNSGGNWTPATNGEPDSFVSDIVVDPSLAGSVYAAGASGVFRSTDSGGTWAPLTGGVVLPAVGKLAFDADGRTLYAGTQAIGLAARTLSPGRGPSLVTGPHVSGTARRRRTLNGSAGAWDGNPAPTLTIAWQRCTTKGKCTAIKGAGKSTYKVATADVGRRLRIAVTATNAIGSASANSNRTAVVRSAPVVRRKPKIRGKLRVGRKLRARKATFAAYPKAKFKLHWQRCPAKGGSCRNIKHATKSTYTPSPADAGHRLRLVMTATNKLGRAKATSKRSKVVR